MNLTRAVTTWPSGREDVEWGHWVTRTTRETLEGREAEIAEEAYQLGLSDAEVKE